MMQITEKIAEEINLEIALIVHQMIAWGANTMVNIVVTITMIYLIVLYMEDNAGMDLDYNDDFII